MNPFHLFHWRGASEARLLHFEMQKTDVHDADEAKVRKEFEDPKSPDAKKKIEHADSQPEEDGGKKKLEKGEEESATQKAEKHAEKAEQALQTKQHQIDDINNSNKKLEGDASKDKGVKNPDAIAEVGSFAMTAGLSETTDFTTKTDAKKPVAEEKTVAAEKPADTAADQAKTREQKKDATAKEQPTEGTAAQGAKKDEGAR